MLAKVDIKDIRYIESNIQKAYNAGYVLWERAKEDPCQVNCQSCERGSQSCQTVCQKTVQCGSRQACGGQNPCGACEKTESSTS